MLLELTVYGHDTCSQGSHLALKAYLRTLSLSTHSNHPLLWQPSCNQACNQWQLLCPSQAYWHSLPFYPASHLGQHYHTYLLPYRWHGSWHPHQVLTKMESLNTRQQSQATSHLRGSGRFFSCCSLCSQHAPVHHFASWATLCGLPTFWIPMGLMLTSHVLPFISVHLDSLCTSTSLFPPDCLDYSAHAHSLSTQSMHCQSLPEYLLQIHESLSLFSYLTNALFFAFDT